ncbi:MAG: HAD family phosphatase [Bacteroidales bacterium]|nr:HAD family phosphatase [Bacteroidales bacterium]
MNQEIKDIAVLFDLDGVVFDTEHFYSEFWSEEGRKYRPDVEHLEMKIKGHGLNDIFAEFFPDKNVQQLIQQDIKLMEKRMTFPYIAGVESFIESVHEQNIKICLVTSSKQDKMQRVFNQRPEIKRYFPLMVTADDIEHSKPAPDCYLKGAELCGVLPKDCIVFEDSLAGIASATNASMKVIALCTTYPVSELEGKAEMIIPDFTAINTEDVLRILHNGDNTSR